MKQVWLDHDQHIFLKEELPGTIAGHVRTAIRIYITVIRRYGYSKDIVDDILFACDANDEDDK